MTTNLRLGLACAVNKKIKEKIETKLSSVYLGFTVCLIATRYAPPIFQKLLICLLKLTTLKHQLNSTLTTLMKCAGPDQQLQTSSLDSKNNVENYTWHESIQRQTIDGQMNHTKHCAIERQVRIHRQCGAYRKSVLTVIAEPEPRLRDVCIERRRCH
jgi:hypothetical protein